MENVQHQRIIDCHCHVYPDKIAAKAVKGIGDFYGLHMDMAGTVSDMKNAERDANISDCIIFSVATKQSQVRSINEFIASEVAKDPVHLTGLGTLHPDSDDIDGDIEQIISLGLKGVKLHPDVQQFKIDDYRCLKIYEKCEGRLPILMHTGDKRYDFSNPNRLKPILEIFTGLTVIGAHLGGWSIWEKAARELCGFGNFYVDCSSSLYALDKTTATGIIQEYGSERVLFGTDYPMWEPKAELARFDSLPLTEKERQDILWKNAVRLFGIG